MNLIIKLIIIFKLIIISYINMSAVNGGNKLKNLIKGAPVKFSAPSIPKTSDHTICIITSATNGILGTVFAILLVIYDILNPTRNHSSYKEVYSAIAAVFGVLMVVNIGGLLRDFYKKMNNQKKIQVGGNVLDNFGFFIKMMSGGILKSINFTLFITGFLFATFKPKIVSKMILSYLCILIIFLLILLFAANYERSGKLNNLIKNDLPLKTVLTIQGFMILIMSVFSLFNTFAHTFWLIIIKIIYIIILLIFAIYVDGYFEFTEGCSQLVS